MAESNEMSTKNLGKAVPGNVEAVICPVLQAHGLSLFDLSLRLEQGGWVLRVTVDTQDGSTDSFVSIDQCADVSRDLSTVLDVDDFFPHAYALEVSSPGVERPLRGPSDYVRFKGRRAKITLHEPMDQGAVIRGLLVGLEGDVLRVDVDLPSSLSIPLDRIKRANLVYEMPGQKKKGNSKKKRRSGKERRD